jgi:hypothetical protein
MKKILVFMGLVGATQVVYAANPEPPLLLTPLSSPALASDSPVSFTWTNSKAANNYRLIVSTTSDFSGYNQKTKSCRNKVVCFTTTVSTPSYSLSNLKSMLQPDKNYFWRVESINSQGTSTSSIAGFAFGNLAKPVDAKYTIVKVPNITAVSTDSPSVEQGKTIKISATPDAALPTIGSYTVKVDYGNGLVPLTGAAPNYSVTITPVKSATYTVGIYDDKNVLKSNKMTGTFEVTAPIPANVAPVLTQSSNTSFSKININDLYAVTLSATDANGDLRQITMDWGDGSTDSVNVEDGQNLSLTHIYTTASSPAWKATAVDYFDALSNVISQTVTVAAPIPVVVTSPTVTATPPTATPTTPAVVTTPRFVAIDSTGKPVTNARDWKCTTDTKTNLMWELKNNDNGLHDKDWTYSWYEPDPEKNGYDINYPTVDYTGYERNGTCRNSLCNTYDFMIKTNIEGLCGATDWRLPTKKELEGLIVCSDGDSVTLRDNEPGDICTGKPKSPTVDSVFFPLTKSDWYWTSSTYTPVLDTIRGTSTTKTTGTTTTTTTTIVNVVDTAPKKQPKTSPILRIDYDSAWTVLFYDGSSHAANKGSSARIRLVRDAK